VASDSYALAEPSSAVVVASDDSRGSAETKGGNRKQNSKKQTQAKSPVTETAAATMPPATEVPVAQSTETIPVVAMADSTDGASPPVSSSTDLTPAAVIPKSRYVTIPFESSEGFTVGMVNCPVVLSGNRVWDKSSQSVQRRLEGSFDGQGQTALSPDGRLLAAASKPPDQQNTAVTVWDTETGKQLFTSAGDSKRFADVILLSSSSLYIGDRWSEELLVWDCGTGKTGKPIKLNEAKFKRGNAALSHDGLFVAAMAQGRMVILNTADGNIAGLMQNPAKTVRMKRVSLQGDKNRSKGRNQDVGIDAEPVFAALQSLAFSIDNKELAGFSTFPRSRLMAWNSQGELTVDQAAAAAASGTQGNALQWFVDRDALLVSGSILDRKTGRVVLTTLKEKAKRTSVDVYNDDNLLCVLRNSPTDLSIVPIPWQTISNSLEQISNTDSALLAVGSPVSLQVLLTDLLGQPSPEIDDVRKTFREALALEGLKVEQGRPTVFRIRVAETPEQKTSILDRLIPIQQRQTSSATETVPAGDCIVMELLTSMEATTPIWRMNLGSLADLGLADVPRRVAADKLMALIDEVSFPYFIPRDEMAVGLPIVID
jgi:hypothetical protein